MALIILILWAYACLTGLPPSVIRAATMFTFVAIGTNLKRLTNVYGSILISLFILLFIDPFIITQVGFQLSYAAVLGIVFLQPRIYGLLPESRYWLIDQIWAITAVSIAAQLATFPLTLFYFNQFPTYFMVSNLVVIPAAFLIIPAGFLYFLFKAVSYAFFSHVADLLGAVLDYLLYGLNYLIKQVQNLPYSLIDELFITTPEFYLLYGGMAGIILGVTLQHKGWLFIGLGITLVLAGELNYRYWKHQQLAKLAILDVDNHTVVAHLTPGKAEMRGDAKVLAQDAQMKFATYRFLWSKGLKRHDIVKQRLKKPSLDSARAQLEKRLMGGKGNRLLIVDETVALPDTTAEPLRIHTLLLLKEPKLPPHKIDRLFQVDRVVLGTEFPPWEVGKWEKLLHRSGIKCHVLGREGALVENL